MRVLVVFLVIGCLAVTSVYGLTQEERKRAIAIYNFTADQYKVILGLLDDLKDSKIDTILAEKKLGEWKEHYQEMTQDAPPEVRKMRELMSEVIDVCKELADDYRPNHQKTKDLLEELEDVKARLMTEMTEVKYMLH